MNLTQNVLLTVTAAIAEHAEYIEMLRLPAISPVGESSWLPAYPGRRSYRSSRRDARRRRNIAKRTR